ncbi:hypothetical protein LAD77_01210 [Klebsiella pneumoniae]|nr:hypothetical protein [Klebsiella pneumoniae]
MNNFGARLAKAVDRQNDLPLDFTNGTGVFSVPRYTDDLRTRQVFKLGAAATSISGIFIARPLLSVLSRRS